MGMFESNAVRLSLALARSTTDICTTRTKTSNQKPKDSFGSIQYTVGKSSHLKIGRTYPTGTKKGGALNFFSGKKPLKSEPKGKKVTFANLDGPDPENATTRGSQAKDNMSDDNQESETTVAPRNNVSGNTSSKKKKGRCGGKRKKNPAATTKERSKETKEGSQRDQRRPECGCSK